MKPIAVFALLVPLAIGAACSAQDREAPEGTGTAQGKFVVGDDSAELKHAYATRVKNKRTGTVQLTVYLSDQPIPEAALFDPGKLESLASGGGVRAVGLRIDQDQKATEALYFHPTLPAGLSVLGMHEFSTRTFTQDQVEGSVVQKPEGGTSVHFEASFSAAVQSEPLAVESSVDPSAAPAQRVRQELAAEGIEFDESTFLRSVSEGDLKTVKRFLAAGMSAQTSSKWEGTALMVALQAQHEAVALALIEAGASVNVGTEHGQSPVGVAASQGQLAVLRKLLQAGADVNLQAHRSHLTPLMSAAYAGNAEAVKALLDAGANVKKRNSSGGSALYYAVWGEHVEVARLLIDAGAEVQRDLKKLLAAADDKKNAAMRALLESAAR